MDDYWNNKPVLTLPEFAALLSRHCQGDWWERVLPIKANLNAGDCEACGTHPITPEHAATLNHILEAIKASGGPAPTSLYPHCGNDLFIEWHGGDNHENAVYLDVNNPFGRDALVRLHDQPTDFVRVGN